MEDKLKKNYLFSIIIIFVASIVGGYSYDFYKAKKLLDLKALEAKYLVSDALDLRLFHFIQDSLESGEASQLKAVLKKHIDNETIRISDKLGEYEFEEFELKLINEAVSGQINPCSEIEKG